jgi:hypothetical protein
VVDAPLAPERSEVVQQMRAALAGEISREEAADWAGQWVYADRADVSDPVVWRGLMRLVGIDLQTDPDTYLHSDVDIVSWIEALEARE